MTQIQERFNVGSVYRMNLKVDQALIDQFVELSGDRNPIHIDTEEARSYGYARSVAHGCILSIALSKMIGTEIPGPGAMWLSQSVEWTHPVYVGDNVELVVTVEIFSRAGGILGLDVVATNQKTQIVMKGKSRVKVGEKLMMQKNNEKKNGKVALVTGASRGIGAGIAKRLGSNGWKVAVHYHKSQQDAREVAKEVSSQGGEARIFQADLNNEEETSCAVDEILKVFGQVDVVVHGASPALQNRKVAELEYGDVERFLKPYLGGALILVSKLSPQMIKHKFGRFIFLGTSSLFGTPPTGMTPYVVAKEALWGFVKCVATELGPFGITANMVSPGMTITDLTGDIPIRVKELEARKSSVRRLAQIEDTAEIVAFLANNASSYINGINLPVTGGPI